MKELDEIFLNDEISDYEKSILYFALNSNITDMYYITPKDINQIADLLSISLDFLQKVIGLSKGSQKRNYDYGNYFSNLGINYNPSYSLFFYNIYLYLTINNQINEWKDGYDQSNLIENKNLLISINTNFITFNYNNTYIQKYYDQNQFTDDELNSFSSESLKLFLNYYDIFLKSKLWDLNNNGKLELFFEVYVYELTKKLDSMYFLFIITMIINSPFISVDFKNIGNEFRNEISPILKDTKLISIRINSMYQDTTILPNGRTRSNSDTTRLLLIYGFENFDSYFLRLDLKHKGRDCIHFNNNSPGGRKSYLLCKKEYDNIISKYPKIKEYFIEYSSHLYMLKEKINLDVDKEIKGCIKEYETQYSHYNLFEGFDESEVIEFIELLSKYMPMKYFSKIDKENLYAIKCTNFNKLMYNVNLLFLYEYFNQINEMPEGIEKKIMCNIIKYAYNSKIIDKIDEDLNNVGYIKMIISDVKKSL